MSTSRRVLTYCLKRFKSSSQWLRRQEADPYVEKAKIYNYRCRSAFKLLEINNETNILQPGMKVIDLGAAPGSWTQVAVQKVNANGCLPYKPQGSVISIDKLQIFPIQGATVMSNLDFSTIEAHDKVIAALNGKQVDLVLSDMAPSATGIRELDKDRIIALCYMALRFAALVSKKDASLLFKVWDGKEVPVLETDLARFYNTIKIIKPNASRSESSEKYFLAKGFRGIQRPLENNQWG
ncbi:rRNA methyltransferase 2, mitochondrial [Hyposmocoma kahamanoa]|uniref:rRNA methyltransferase 2, mitochondrial n=1 Tax=Hyposmocoma kahamanoa TaxID=1477025 RepID=UPI000E6D86A8|nr:rRNA methyltransferase 2, mitochondrial [Hyposmocoma kahamanoa]XP_026324698.1 rRNA methyltransferase 2, mitochondrial [Hyposmocoma kahamanoa]XP_026324700.1 rRNA methyltransferase 2, mitochondrial [Hyposmocoma kahamanoa]